MPSLGPAEILVILVIALLVFGPNKMPELARQVGRGIREFKRVQEHLSTELRDVVSEFDGSKDSSPADAAPATGNPATGDPVPTLPPRVEPDGSTTPDATIAPIAPVPPVPPVPPVAPTPSDAHADLSRGQRVWLPPTPPTDA